LQGVSYQAFTAWQIIRLPMVKNTGKNYLVNQNKIANIALEIIF
jgi:hypothetical protein